ncbi:hypothetical protein D3093_33575 (plasmid) [Azospirillum argentinense]|uniref:LysM domain-containing protein n=1 Tax=Azospirillum argentinense TaxID=2970906 RepID=A0A4D8PNX4_9PROT|nr:hypothetical protein [Azospirillum argentinense]QCO00184.1 hypothetical protein D3093_33575 [Azospirillum argentinense]
MADAPRPPPDDGDENGIHRLNFKGTAPAKEMARRLADLSRANREADAAGLLDLLAADQGLAVVGDPLTVRVANLVRDGAATIRLLVAALLKDGPGDVELHPSGALQELERRQGEMAADLADARRQNEEKAVALADARRRGEENAAHAGDLQRRLTVADQSLGAAHARITELEGVLEAARQSLLQAERMAAEHPSARTMATPVHGSPSARLRGAGDIPGMDPAPDAAGRAGTDVRADQPATPPASPQSTLGGRVDRFCKAVLRGTRNAAMVLIASTAAMAILGVIMTQSNGVTAPPSEADSREAQMLLGLSSAEGEGDAGRSVLPGLAASPTTAPAAAIEVASLPPAAPASPSPAFGGQSAPPPSAEKATADAKPVDRSPSPPPALPPPTTAPPSPPASPPFIAVPAAPPPSGEPEAVRRLADILDQAGRTLERLSAAETELGKRLAGLPAASAPAPDKPKDAPKTVSSGPKAAPVKPRADARRRVADIRDDETLARAAQRHGVRLERIYDLNPALEAVPPDVPLTKGQVWIPNDF